MFKILNAPSPFHPLNSKRIAIIIGIGIFVAFFYWCFNPLEPLKPNFHINLGF